MGNCAGCTGPQRRTFQVQRLEQNSPIKNRLSNGKKYYPHNSQAREYSYNEKDKINEKVNYNQNQMFTNVLNLGYSKVNSATQLVSPYNNLNNDNNFAYNILNQVVKTHIKLYPDSPQYPKDTITKMQRSYVNNNQNDFYNNQLGASSHRSVGMANSINTMSNPLIKSIHNQSRKILQQSYSGEKTPPRTQQMHTNEFRIQQSTIKNNYESLTSFPMSRYQDNLENKTSKNNKNYIQHQSPLPFKKYSKYTKNLTVIEEMLQQDHKTPIQIKKERKKNGQDVIYDHLQGLPDELQPIQLPNFAEYLPILQLVTQKA